MELLTSKILDASTGIGQLMLENGAETYRVEDTVYRVATNYGMKKVSVFSVPTALIVTVREPNGIEYTRLQRVTEQKSNLQVIADANDLSRRIAQTDISLNDALDEIALIKNTKSPYSTFQEFIIAGLTCGFFAILFQGNIQDLIAASITGSLGYIAFLYTKKITNIHFFSELLGSFFIGWIAFFLTSIGVGNDINIIIVASVMTLVPGKAITNGIRDLMASHLLSGVSVLAEALLTASAIGIGVATVLSFI